MLSHLGLDGDMPFAAASGGRKRQTLLALAWNVDFIVESMSGGQVLTRADIEPLSKGDVLRGYEHDGADRAD
ncbi:MAG: hypothetical protein ACR2M1_14625 [Gemmatimonadaceae bacterium]